MTPTPSTAPTSPSPPGRRCTPSGRTSRSPPSWPGCTACSAPRRRYRGRAGVCESGAPGEGQRPPRRSPAAGSRGRRAAPAPAGRQPGFPARRRGCPAGSRAPPALSLAPALSASPQVLGRGPGGRRRGSPGCSPAFPNALKGSYRLCSSCSCLTLSPGEEEPHQTKAQVGYQVLGARPSLALSGCVGIQRDKVVCRASRAAPSAVAPAGPGLCRGEV